MRAIDMTNTKARTIAQRMSLRPPLVASLELLTRLYDAVQPHKGVDLAAAIEQVRGVLAELQGEVPALQAAMARHALQQVGDAKGFSDFQRQFVNLCFALATGVGKTRLMGSFIAWLYLEHGIRHFFVVAPNLTIYRKLVEDFGDPSAPKYVFKGLSEFANDRPLLITGDDYEDGRAERFESARPWIPGLRNLVEGTLHINVFNIAKLSKDAKTAGKGEDAGKPPRIKRLHEYLGQSYFGYLAGLTDLVLIMDEAHNYRADAAMAVLDELKPILGLEVTATPFRTRGQQREWFKNIAYHYQLRDAMSDEFVKTPEVAYRKNLDAAQLSKTEDGRAQLEAMKIEDAVALHEETRDALNAHATEKGVKFVKPFILVVASDIEHAKRLQAVFESDEFHGGYFKGKTVRIDSKQGAEEKAKNTEQLLAVERIDNPIEVVLHVESLEEGWDVTNLYTILPLRAADSPGLVLQSIGRGLRLPYGELTKNPRVDRVTIVSHDRYAAIVDEAKREDSDLTGLIRTRDLDAEQPAKVKQIVSLPTAVTHAEQAAAKKLTPTGASPQQTTAIAQKAKQVASLLPAILEGLAGIKQVSDLNKPEVQIKVAAHIDTVLAAQAAVSGAVQQDLLAEFAMPTTEQLVAAMAQSYVESTIDVPRIVVFPSADFNLVYAPFTLQLDGVSWKPAATDLVRKDLTNDEARLHHVKTQGLEFDEDRPENYIVRQIYNYNDVPYDKAAEIIQDLAGQFVQHLRKFNADDEAVATVLVQHEQEAGRIVYEQLVANRQEVASTWTTTIHPEFETLRPTVLNVAAGDDVRDFRVAVDKQKIKQYVFGGFRRAAAQYCKFDSDAERRFAVLLEEVDSGVLRWMKPKTGQLQLSWRYKGKERRYEPDFMVETLDRKWLIEVKALGEMSDPEVIAKAEAGKAWCQTATDHAASYGTKPWSYKMIPDTKIISGFDFAGIIASV